MSRPTSLPIHPHTSLRVGGWLPPDPRPIRAYVAGLQAELAAEPEPPKLADSVRDLKELIEGDEELRLLAEWMIKQVPAKYKHDPSGGPQIQDLEQMYQLINKAIQLAPPFNDTGLVGFPVNAILDWSMGTAAGSMFFLDPRVNEQFKIILNDWNEYLFDPASLSAFGPHSWGSHEAQKAIGIEQFIHQRDEPPWGFANWNAFFSREFIPGEREVADPDDDHVIVHGCESSPFAIQNGVRREDDFWIKSQPYSLKDMLCEYADGFVGGTVYQAFLDALSYHRWHAPVGGKIVEARVIPGAYFAEAISEGLDPAGPNLSQGYIAHVATRALYVIETEHLGRVAVVQVGMADCSSCKIKKKDEDGEDVPLEKGDVVKKGDQIGFFLFGGSTYCLVFEPNVIESFEVDAIPGVQVTDTKPRHVKSKLATAKFK